MSDAPKADWEAQRLFAGHIARRIEEGEPRESVRADLISRGLTPETADWAMTKYAPRQWTLRPIGRATRALGLVVLFAGCVLALGNRFGFFRTFPFAGSIGMTVGCVVYTAAGGKWYRSAVQPKANPGVGDKT